MPFVLGIAGHSGAGKTTLIEALLPKLAERGWRVGVLKHDAHRLHLDREGKDTARFFEAGAATVCAHDPTQSFVRNRSEGPVPLAQVIVDLPADLDLVIVEGHKDAPIDKLVLKHPEPRDPIVGPSVIATLEWGDDRLALAESLVVEWLERAWRSRVLGTAIFVGGRSKRMGLPKAMLEYRGKPMVDHMAALLGSIGDRVVVVGVPTEPDTNHGSVAAGAAAPGDPAQRWCPVAPVVLDAPGVAGPLGGLLALLRHDPTRAWLLVGCDQPAFRPEHAEWLLAARRPGAWMVLPRIEGRTRPEPFGAIVEPELRTPLERAAACGVRAMHAALQSAPVALVTPPDSLASGWQSANTPEQWRELTGSAPRIAHGPAAQGQPVHGDPSRFRPFLSGQRS